MSTCIETSLFSKPRLKKAGVYHLKSRKPIIFSKKHRQSDQLTGQQIKLTFCGLTNAEKRKYYIALQGISNFRSCLVNNQQHFVSIFTSLSLFYFKLFECTSYYNKKSLFVNTNLHLDHSFIQQIQPTARVMPTCPILQTNRYITLAPMVVKVM